MQLPHQPINRPRFPHQDTILHFTKLSRFQTFCCRSSPESNLHKFEVEDLDSTRRFWRFSRTICLIVCTNICVFRLSDAKAAAVRQADRCTYGWNLSCAPLSSTPVWLQTQREAEGGTPPPGWKRKKLKFQVTPQQCQSDFERTDL